MENIVVEAGIAILTFGLTNIDDLFLLSFYFSNPSYRPEHIVSGQYLGIFIIVGISLIAALAGKSFDTHWIGLLGVIPILIGIKDLVLLLRNKEKKELELSTSKGTGFIGISLVTVANGGDNIGVYTPLFANSTNHQCTIYLILFAFLTALWCGLGYLLVSHPSVKKYFSDASKWLLPVFLILLGITILYESGVIF